MNTDLRRKQKANAEKSGRKDNSEIFGQLGGKVGHRLITERMRGGRVSDREKRKTLFTEEGQERRF